VVDGLKRLRHDAVVGGDHDDHDVGDLGAAGTHAGKGFVTRRIEEDDLAAGSRRAFLGELHLVSADVLGDAAGFAGCDVGFANGVEQRGLAVIDVAHDGDHGRTGNFELAGVFGFENLFDGLVGDLFFVADDGGAAPNLAATSLTISASSDWLTVTKTPLMSSVAIRSLARTSSFSARSLTLMPSVTVISRVIGSGSPPYCTPP
jgi:hypothetical protein